MPVRVSIPTPLRILTGNASEVSVEATDLVGMVNAIDAKHPGIKERLMKDDGKFRSFIIFFVNEQDARSLAGEKTVLKDGDSVDIVPSIAGGENGFD